MIAKPTRRGRVWLAGLVVAASLTACTQPDQHPANPSARGGAVTASSLLTAPVPALCEHPAGRLVEGSLPGIPSDQGFVTIATAYKPAPGPIPAAVAPVFADLTGHGATDAAAVVSCSAGGVGWPDTVVFYAPGPTMLGYADLSSVHQAEHANVESMSAAGRDVQVTWLTTDGCCTDPQTWTGQLHWDGKALLILGAARTR